MVDPAQGLDPVQGKVVAKVPVGDEPHNVAVTPDGRWIFVTNYGEDTVSVIDGRTLTPVRKITVGRAPTRAGVTPDGRFLLVNTEKANQTAVIDVAQMQVVHTMRSSMILTYPLSTMIQSLILIVEV